MPDPSLTIHTLRPFIPSRDFETSKRFYLDLGFTLAHDGEDLAILELSTCSFLLQKYYDEIWAKNCMMQIVVDDLDSWWRHIDALKLPDKYDISHPLAPKLQPWGMRVAYLYDPAGVLWHIAELPGSRS